MTAADAAAGRLAAATAPSPTSTAAAVPRAGDNIVTRAAALLAAHHDVERARPTCWSTRPSRSPAGMAGGSADAAAALVALDRLWELRPPRAELLALAAQLGSDVPFALLGGTALGTGRGEVVEPVPDPGDLVVGRRTPPGRAVHAGRSTATSTSMCPDAAHAGRRPTTLLAALATGDPRALAAALHNDLQDRRSTCARSCGR